MIKCMQPPSQLYLSRSPFPLTSDECTKTSPLNTASPCAALPSNHSPLSLKHPTLPHSSLSPCNSIKSIRKHIPCRHTQTHRHIDWFEYPTLYVFHFGLRLLMFNKYFYLLAIYYFIIIKLLNNFLHHPPNWHPSAVILTGILCTIPSRFICKPSLCLISSIYIYLPSVSAPCVPTDYWIIFNVTIKSIVGYLIIY